MLGKKLAIDLGSERVRLLVRGDGMLLDESAGVASPTRRGAQIGEAATQAAASGAELRWPMRGGRIDDGPALEGLLQQLVTRAAGRQRIFKPDAVVAVPLGLGGEDRRVILDILSACGMRTTYLLDAPIAAALGVGLPIGGRPGRLIAHLGAATSEVAFLALDGCLSSRSLTGGGLRLQEDVAAAAGGVDASTSRQLVREVVSAVHSERVAEVAGRRITAAMLQPAADRYVRDLVNALREVIAESPPALAAGLEDIGLSLTGGAARLAGLPEALEAALGLPVRLAPHPDLCAVRGAGTAAESLDVLRRNVMYIR